MELYRYRGSPKNLRFAGPALLGRIPAPWVVEEPVFENSGVHSEEHMAVLSHNLSEKVCKLNDRVGRPDPVCGETTESGNSQYDIVLGSFLPNLVIEMLWLRGVKNIVAALRPYGWKSPEVLALIGLPTYN